HRVSRGADLDGELEVLVKAAASGSDGRLALHNLSDRLGRDVVLTKVGGPQRHQKLRGVLSGHGDTAHAVDTRQVRHRYVRNPAGSFVQRRVRCNGKQENRNVIDP